jgi:hypothetical protein
VLTPLTMRPAIRQWRVPAYGTYAARPTLNTG